jgi:hypothetical protein
VEEEVAVEVATVVAALVATMGEGGLSKSLIPCKVYFVCIKL